MSQRNPGDGGIPPRGTVPAETARRDTAMYQEMPQVNHAGG